jgi:hypothetical protein
MHLFAGVAPFNSYQSDRLHALLWIRTCGRAAVAVGTKFTTARGLSQVLASVDKGGGWWATDSQIGLNHFVLEARQGGVGRW